MTQSTIIKRKSTKHIRMRHESFQWSGREQHRELYKWFFIQHRGASNRSHAREEKENLVRGTTLIIQTEFVNFCLHLHFELKSFGHEKNHFITCMLAMNCLIGCKTKPLLWKWKETQFVIGDKRSISWELNLWYGLNLGSKVWRDRWADCGNPIWVPVSSVRHWPDSTGGSRRGSVRVWTRFMRDCPRTAEWSGGGAEWIQSKSSWNIVGRRNGATVPIRAAMIQPRRVIA